MTTTSEIGGVLYAGSPCSNCGTPYDKCTDQVLGRVEPMQPCCSTCGYTDTHNPQQAQPEVTGFEWIEDCKEVLRLVARERVAQMAKHGDAMSHLPDGTGPDVSWLSGIDDTTPATEIEAAFRWDYGNYRGAENPDGELGQLTKMHLVREELAEAFELDGDSPEFIAEIIQVAALCVQWAEIKLREARS